MLVLQDNVLWSARAQGQRCHPSVAGAKSHPLLHVQPTLSLTAVGGCVHSTNHCQMPPSLSTGKHCAVLSCLAKGEIPLEAAGQPDTAASCGRKYWVLAAANLDPQNTLGLNHCCSSQQQKSAQSLTWLTAGQEGSGRFEMTVK